MMRLAVVGEDVSSSSSPAIHTFLFRAFHRECSYEKVSIPQGEFHVRAEELFSRFDAFNVTIPYKEEIISHLKEVRGEARVLSSCNTVLSRGRIGLSTDGGGFSLMLSEAGWEVKNRSVLVLGAGGAGRSVIHALALSGAAVFVYEKDRSRLERFHRRTGGFTPCESVPQRAFDLIVNCTGVGMRASAGELPRIAYESGEEDTAERLLKECGAAVDLIYEPARSQFLRVAEGYNKPVLNGEAMLFFQAYLADRIFLGETPDAFEACRLRKKFMENL